MPTLLRGSDCDVLGCSEDCCYRYMDPSRAGACTACSARHQSAAVVYTPTAPAEVVSAVAQRALDRAQDAAVSPARKRRERSDKGKKRGPRAVIAKDGVSKQVRYWAKVGIEIEGGWETSPRVVADRVNGAVVVGDGSVHTNAEYSSEIITQPYASLASAKAALEQLYPDETNSSCGMHVHVSFKTEEAYSRLMSEEFYFYYLLRWQTWGQNTGIVGEFWRRLRGENDFCRREFRVMEQAPARSKGSARYCHLNYCYRHHGTIESRLLPMFKDKKFALLALEETISIYQDYLNNYAVVDLPEELVTTVDPGIEPEPPHSVVLTTDVIPIEGKYDFSGPKVPRAVAPGHVRMWVDQFGNVRGGDFSNFQDLITNAAKYAVRSKR